MKQSTTSYEGFLHIYWSKQHFTYVSNDEDGLTFDFIIEPGAFVGEHVHLDVAEIFHINDGEFTFKLDGQPVLAKAGDIITVDIGVRHSIKNSSNQDGKARVTFRPCSDMATILRMFGELAKDNPNELMNGLKLFYLIREAGLKPFATLTPPIADKMLVLFVLLLGKIFGWKKGLARYLPQ